MALPLPPLAAAKSARQLPLRAPTWGATSSNEPSGLVQPLPMRAAPKPGAGIPAHLRLLQRLAVPCQRPLGVPHQLLRLQARQAQGGPGGKMLSNTAHSRSVRMRACRADAAIHITPQKATCNNPGHESAGGWLVAYGLSTQLAPSIHAQDAVLLSFTRISNAAHPSDAVHLLVAARPRRALVPLAAALLLLCSIAGVGGACAVRPAGQLLERACNAAQSMGWGMGCRATSTAAAPSNLAHEGQPTLCFLCAPWRTPLSLRASI